jgi:hypothetical protein
MYSRSLMVNSHYPACINRDHREEQHCNPAQNEATVSLAESIQTSPKVARHLELKEQTTISLNPAVQAVRTSGARMLPIRAILAEQGICIPAVQHECRYLFSDR